MKDDRSLLSVFLSSEIRDKCSFFLDFEQKNIGSILDMISEIATAAENYPDITAAICKRASRIIKKTLRTEKENIELAHVQYEKYLRTRQWKFYSDTIIENADYECAVCGWSNGDTHKPGLHAHHKNYDNLGKERVCDLVALCPICHKKQHAKSEENE